MAGFKSYNNVDPNEIMSFIDKYNKQLYPKESPTDFNAMVEEQQKQDEVGRQADFQSKLATSLPSATDTSGVYQDVIDAAKSTGQADAALKGYKGLDQEELDSLLKQIGGKPDSTLDEVRNDSQKALMSHGQIKDALSIEKTGKGQLINRKDGVYLVDPIDGSSQKVPGIGPNVSGKGGGKGFSYIEDPASPSDPSDPTVVPKFIAVKNGSKELETALANGDRVLNQAQVGIKVQQSVAAQKAQADAEAKKPGFFGSIANMINGTSPTTNSIDANSGTPGKKSSNQEQPTAAPKGYEFTGNVDAQGRRGIRRKNR